MDNAKKLILAALALVALTSCTQRAPETAPSPSPPAVATQPTEAKANVADGQIFLTLTVDGVSHEPRAVMPIPEGCRDLSNTFATVLESERLVVVAAECRFEGDSISLTETAAIVDLSDDSHPVVWVGATNDSNSNQDSGCATGEMWTFHRDDRGVYAKVKPWSEVVFEGENAGPCEPEGEPSTERLAPRE